MARLRLSLLGAGRAARVVARWLVESKTAEISQVANSSLESAQAATAFIGAGRAVKRIRDLDESDCLLVGLPDQRLGEGGSDLVEGGAGLAFHLSGSLDSSVLEGWAPHVASLHPARAFAQPDRALAQMAGTWITAEGDPEALDRLRPLFTAAGAQWQCVDRARKPLYHAATVVASNYLVTLNALARDLALAAGIEESHARDLLAGLQSGTLANLDRTDAAQALTGPIERADLDQIRRLQQAMVEVCPARSVLLSELGLATLELARGARGERPADEQIEALFTRP